MILWTFVASAAILAVAVCGIVGLALATFLGVLGAIHVHDTAFDDSDHDDSEEEPSNVICFDDDATVVVWIRCNCGEKACQKNKWRRAYITDNITTGVTIAREEFGGTRFSAIVLPKWESPKDGPAASPVPVRKP